MSKKKVPVYCEGFCGSSRKESSCNVGDLGLIPGLGRSPGEGKGLPIPIFWPGEFHGLYIPWGHKQLDTTELLSLSFFHISPELTMMLLKFGCLAEI